MVEELTEKQTRSAVEEQLRREVVDILHKVRDSLRSSAAGNLEMKAVDIPMVHKDLMEPQLPRRQLEHMEMLLPETARASWAVELDRLVRLVALAECREQKLLLFVPREPPFLLLA